MPQDNDKGQKISETNQLGQTRYFEYDDNGQLIKVTLPEVNGQLPVYEYTYDAPKVSTHLLGHFVFLRTLFVS
ncbi:MAG: hypothetical protein LBE12_01070 [Planctomycetaceae bacterium]|nr:hypothetical protein [Planctomycetaceae bacterium]